MQCLSPDENGHDKYKDSFTDKNTHDAQRFPPDFVSRPIYVNCMSDEYILCGTAQRRSLTWSQSGHPTRKSHSKKSPGL